MDAGRIRNFGIVAHIDAGKTTLSERLLYLTGVITRLGEVHEGTATLDWMEEERKRGITITAAAATLQWREHELHLVDTPGHVDFTVEVERSMRVLDGAVLLVSAVDGVQAQTETVWRQVRRHALPALAFVNQMDRVGADFQRCLDELRKRLRARPVPLQVPIGAEKEHVGVIDLLERAALYFEQGPRGRTFRRAEVPAQLHDEVEVLRSELVDLLAEQDDAVLAAALEGKDPGAAALRAALRPRVHSGELVPVLCGSALRTIGVQPLLDAIVEILPSPLERPSERGVDPRDGSSVERPPRADAPTTALAFKTVADRNEDLVYVRVYAGSIRPGDGLWNARTQRHERVARVLRMLADERAPLAAIGVGDIAALAGLHGTASGDTLCDPKAPIRLHGLELPEPVITQRFEPREGGEREKLRAALARLCFEDPALSVREDAESGQWLVSGLGELHLEIARQRLEQDFHAPVRAGKPGVAYREAIGARARARAIVDRAIGGRDAYAEVELELAPHARGAGHAIEIAFAPELAPAPAMRAALEEALRAACSVGPRLGFPLHDASIRVLACASKSEREHAAAYAQAAVEALQRALEQADAHVLEPLVRVELDTPSEFAGGLIADLGARGAEVSDVQAEGERRRIRAEVALADVFGYSTAVRSLSQGRAGLALEPCGFRRVENARLEARGLHV